jgi:hypothetical protein
MAPSPGFDGDYARHLFEGPQPTTVGFSEQLAFRHYLHALRGQVRALEQSSYDEARAAQDILLDEAEGLLTIEMSRVAGRIAYGEPDISAQGEIVTCCFLSQARSLGVRSP